ncbi:MAG: ATP phosphoribosyltransferase [Chloroflexi bacterium]|nr:ATP phosphoribosyltransferase [Chloroflexota bacterium]
MRTDIRFAIPSNGRLETDSLAFLQACGLAVQRLNPRQYTATIPALKGVTAVWQRQNDIVRGIQLGSIDFAIVGLDSLEERCQNGAQCPEIIVLHDQLDISHCELHLAVPMAWATVENVNDLAGQARIILAREGRPLRVATKYPNLTARFLSQYDIPHELVRADGTLEIAPAIGYADMIADLVSSGTTLRDNQLKPLGDGMLVHSQAVLVGNKASLRERPEVLAIARELLEYFEAHLRAEGCYTVTANVRGESPQAIAKLMLDHAHIRGLQGPTISPVVPHNGTTQSMVNWYAINIIVQRPHLAQAIRELRAIGGSGVIVTEVKYIFEEEPERYKQMLKSINNE